MNDIMTLYEAALVRHSVRQYVDKELSGEQISLIEEMIDTINTTADLHIQLVTDEPKAFQSMMAKYGKFSGVKNYLVMAGRAGEHFDENIGYYGENLVLYAQTLGLNTCWVGLTYHKVDGAFTLEKGEKLACVIALGYGATQGLQHKSKSITEVSNANDNSPVWFQKGVECALLAPTAINQQKFHFELLKSGEVKVTSKFTLVGYSNIDLGIAKLHFKLGAENAGNSDFKFVMSAGTSAAALP